MRPTTKPLLVAGLLALLALAACSNDGDDDSPLEANQSQGSEQAADTPEREGEDDTGSGGEGSGTGGDPDAEPLGTTRAQRENLANVVVPLRIDVVRLERHGELVELGLLVSNEADDDGTDTLDWDPLTDLGGGPGINGNYDIREVGIVDPDGQRIYLPALDDQGVCRCTGTGGGAGVSPGESLTLDATIGGLPTDVEAVDVHVPGFPPITGVEVQG
jgi:hypothetical protein